MPKPRILFVEDEDYIARVIKSSLEDAGYEVFRANSLVQDESKRQHALPSF